MTELTEDASYFYIGEPEAEHLGDTIILQPAPATQCETIFAEKVEVETVVLEDAPVSGDISGACGLLPPRWSTRSAMFLVKGYVA